jgi:IS30 family transposase
MADFVAEIGIPTPREGWSIFLKRSIATRWMVRALTLDFTDACISALIKQAKRLPGELYKSLTWDRGKELADHRRFT